MMANTDFPFSGCRKYALDNLCKTCNRWRGGGSLYLTNP